MCVMDIRPGQRTSTMLQAMAHNVATVEKDLDFLYAVCESRVPEILPSLRRQRETLRKVYAGFLDAFGEQLEREHPVGHSCGASCVHRLLAAQNEKDARASALAEGIPFGDVRSRTLVNEAHKDAQASRRYLTR